MNAHNSADFITHFAPEAIVEDEGHEYKGTAAIKAWIEAAWKKFEPTLEVTRVTENGSETIITGQVSGNFDGSPVELRHYLVITDGKIAALKITA